LEHKRSIILTLFLRGAIARTGNHRIMERKTSASPHSASGNEQPPASSSRGPQARGNPVRSIRRATALDKKQGEETKRPSTLHRQGNSLQAKIDGLEIRLESRIATLRTRSGRNRKENAK
jgi:hypothetical protein